MPFPRGLKFTRRLAEKDGVYYFDCFRKAEHPKDEPRVRKEFTRAKDREIFVIRHDAVYHEPDVAAALGVHFDSPPFGLMVREFLGRVDASCSAGQTDPKTLAFYEGVTQRLVEFFGAERKANQFKTPIIVRYITYRRETGTSAGARIRKEISALGTIFRDCGQPVTWSLRRGAIRAKKKVKVDLGTETIRRFVAAMPPNSIEWRFSVVKFTTAMRNEELYAANVGDVNLDERTLEFILRNKQGERELHVVYLGDLAVEALSPLVTGRAADQPLFTLRGRRLTHSSLRKRFLRASEAATKALHAVDPAAPPIKITAIGSFRAEAATAAIEALGGTHSVSEQLGHKDEKTTRKHYKIGRRKEKIAQSQRVTPVLDRAIR